MTRLHTRIAVALALAAGVAVRDRLHRQRRAGAKRAALPVRSRLAEAAAEQVEDRRHHRTRRRQGRQRLGAQPPERPARPGAPGGDRHRRLLRAAAVDDPHRQERQRHRLVRSAAGARHGRRQPGLRLHRLRHGAQIRSEERQDAHGDACAPNRSRAPAAAATRRRAQRQPGRGSAGPVGTFPQQGGGGRGRGNADPAAQAAQAAALAAWRAKYPPTAPDDRRTGRRDSARRAGWRGVRRGQLVRRTRDGVRSEDVCLQARMGRLRPPAE